MPAAPEHGWWRVGLQPQHGCALHLQSAHNEIVKYCQRIGKAHAEGLQKAMVQHCLQVSNMAIRGFSIKMHFSATADSDVSPLFASMLHLEVREAV